jgi:hypothetical protein
MRKTRTNRLGLAVLFAACSLAAAAALVQHAALPAVKAFDAGAEPPPNTAPSRWSGVYKVTAIAPRGPSTLTTNDSGTLEFSVDGIQVRGTLQGHVAAKMTGMFSTQGETDYTATLAGIVRKASELPQIPKGLSTVGEAVTVNSGRATPASFLMSGMIGTPPYTQPYKAQHSSPDWPLIILLCDGRTTDYDIPPMAMVPDTGHVTVTIHKHP